MLRYYAVETKCGHVGKNKCIYITFPVKATNGKEAAAKAREYKRVKHHHKDAIKSVKEITLEQYNQLVEQNTKDGYLHCKNIQEQRQLENLTERIVEDNYAKRSVNRRERNAEFVQKKQAIVLREIRKSMVYDYDIA